MVDERGCWIWLRACNNKGYGQRWIPEQRRLVQAHQWVYELFKGPMPPGTEIDHLCKVPACVKPEHLEAVTRQEHVRRTHPRRPPPDRLPEPPTVRQVDPADCILWAGSRDRDGYGHKSVNGRTTFVHRWAYEQHYGLIPDGLQIDHLCRNRACYNPEHLEAVTLEENVRRRPVLWSDTCQRGHPWTPDNTLWQKDGKRKCRTCRAEMYARGTQRRRGLGRGS